MSSPLNEEAILAGTDIQQLFRLWDEKFQTAGYDPVPILTRISEIFEEATNVYLQKDPDPFDERHPSRTDPECELGRMLKLLFRKDNFMTRLVNDYLRDNFFTRQSIQKSSLDLNIAACRLILVIMPGLETSAVFQTDVEYLTNRLYQWATDSPEPLQSYATGLLAAAMEVQEIAVNFREHNARLVPLLLKRLHALQNKPKNMPLTNFVLEKEKPDGGESTCAPPPDTQTDMDSGDPDEQSFAHLDGGGSAPNSPSECSLKVPVMNGIHKHRNSSNLTLLPDEIQTREELPAVSAGSSSGMEVGDNQSASIQKTRLARGAVSFSVPTLQTSQMLILRYLTPMGEYQEFLVHVFESNAMQLIFNYIENLNPKDTCLAFESLKYLAALLCHKKFCLEFINRGGLERLLKVPRPSVAATGVSISLYYLAYCEDALERICTMPKHIITDLVKYALWLLGCSHDSGRCHATMFFNLSFQFKVMLDEFDAQDGLRQLYNVISVLPILASNDDQNWNDDQECAERQIVRAVCQALKKYMESHLFFKYTQTTRINNPAGSATPVQPTLKTTALSPEMISEYVRTLQELLPMRTFWPPVEGLIQLGGITLLLRVITLAYEWNFNGRTDTVKSVLDVLTICCVIPKIHQLLCERIELPDNSEAAGFNVILGAAEGEIVIDAEVQKSALAVLINCVCAPIHRPAGSIGRFGIIKKKAVNKSSEELIQKVWECVRSNNGIIVLLQLMQIKVPITDADCIRGMACRALAGLARSDTVKQIMSKLPLFINGQLQSLMRDPILQEKRSDHVTFQKYGIELMERVSGKLNTHNGMDVSLINYHKANVVAQTKIQFNDQQLYHLINDYLLAKGLTQTANELQKEASLSTGTHPKTIAHHQSPFNYRSPIVMPRSRLRARQAELAASFGISPASVPPVEVAPLPPNGRCDDVTVMDVDEPQPIVPIKITKFNKPNTNTTTNAIGTGTGTPSACQNQSTSVSLQKQISTTVDTFTPSTPTQRTIQAPDTTHPSATNKITLDTIITEYLTNQHALCKNPMATCPQFDLFVPHKCPDPRPNKTYGCSNNFAARIHRRQIGFNSSRLDRRLVHSNFAAVRTLRSADSDVYFTACTFSACSSHIFAGTYGGDIKVFNINQSSEEFSVNCHESYINTVKCNRTGSLVLMSGSWRMPNSTLWNVDMDNKQLTNKLSWDEEEYCEFSNVIEDKILGTKSEKAIMYDLNTGQVISTFAPKNFNQYNKNRATFDPTDELVLTDGVLFDVRSATEIHKFDKLNQSISGVFHPNGLEIISNTEVWDLRTFHLLRTVPILDQCHLAFSPQNVIYANFPESDSRLDIDAYTFPSNFKTLDSYDYSSISTIDVKRSVYDLSVGDTGSQIAVVENQGGYDSAQESIVRIYNVGRKKNAEDDNEEEEEEEEEDDDSDGSGDGSDSFNGSLDDDDDDEGSRRRNRRFREMIEEEIFNNSSTSSITDDDDDDDDDGDDDSDDIGIDVALDMNYDDD